MNANTIRHFIASLYGETFPGHAVLWRKQTLESTYYTHSQLNELCALIERLALRDDLYLALGLQRKKSAKRGSTETVVALPGFFADIDFGSMKTSKKVYPLDQMEALRILSSFPLSPTWIVNTGNGLHVFWLLSELVSTNSKRELARAQQIWAAFQRAVSAHFQKHDRQIDSVGDLVRNVSIPGTLNHKSNPPKPVQAVEQWTDRRYSLSEIEALVAPLLEPAFDGKARRQEERFRPADHYAIMEGCSWYRDVVGKGAATCDEPNWHACSSITGRCANGEDIFHTYSRRHPGYHEAQATEKFRRAQAEAGPRSCRSIELDLGHIGCKTCPHHGRITSPIQLGRDGASEYKPGQVGPIPLGYYNSLFLFRNQQTGEVDRKTASQLSSLPELMSLAPKWFWAENFARVDAEGNITGIQTMTAADALIQACRAAGPIDGSAVRGIGVWREGDRLIQNLGGELIDSDQFIYTTISKPLQLSQLPVPSAKLMDFLQKLSWKTPGAPELVSGWAFLSILCGALARVWPIKPRDRVRKPSIAEASVRILAVCVDPGM